MQGYSTPEKKTKSQIKTLNDLVRLLNCYCDEREWAITGSSAMNFWYNKLKPEVLENLREANDIDILVNKDIYNNVASMLRKALTKPGEKFEPDNVPKNQLKIDSQYLKTVDVLSTELFGSLKEVYIGNSDDIQYFNNGNPNKNDISNIDKIPVILIPELISCKELIFQEFQEFPKEQEKAEQDINFLKILAKKMDPSSS